MSRKLRTEKAIRVSLSINSVFIAIVLMTTLVRAAGIDLHLLWDDRCVECHGHAGDFARKFLSVSGDELQGRHHVHDLRRFLHNHYLTESEVDAVYDMLLAQSRNQARFKVECGGCHAIAAKLVRTTLELRDGMLYGRQSGRLVRTFLAHHRELDPDDIEFYTNLLTRVAHEVYRP